MGRPREFDEDEVLERVMSLFWAQGYEATTMSHLLQATGLAKGSLYQAFGDKERLFLKALRRYLERGRQDLRNCLSRADSGYEGLRSWLLENARPTLAQGVRTGCMAVNSAVELAPHNAEVRKILRDHERSMEKLYEECIARGVADRSLASTVDPRSGARWMSTTTYGLQVRAKLGMSHDHGRETVEQALCSIAAA